MKKGRFIYKLWFNNLTDFVKKIDIKKTNHNNFFKEMLYVFGGD